MKDPCPAGSRSITGSPANPSILPWKPASRCPCCGYRTLATPDTTGLCPVCWWEDAGQRNADASEVRLTVNGALSLAEARLHFLRCAASHPRFLAHVRKPRASEQ